MVTHPLKMLIILMVFQELKLIFSIVLIILVGTMCMCQQINGSELALELLVVVMHGCIPKGLNTSQKKVLSIMMVLMELLLIYILNIQMMEQRLPLITAKL